MKFSKYADGFEKLKRFLSRGRLGRETPELCLVRLRKLAISSYEGRLEGCVDRYRRKMVLHAQSTEETETSSVLKNQEQPSNRHIDKVIGLLCRRAAARRLRRARLNISVR